MVDCDFYMIKVVGSSPAVGTTEETLCCIIMENFA